MVTRVHDSWLAAAEKRLLISTAARLPSWVTSDGLTVLGLAGALLTGAAFAAARWAPGFLWLACLGLVVNWFGDSLDGTLARVRQVERPVYGFFLDHSTDVIAQVFIFIGLGFSPLLRFEAACLVLLSYWMAALLTFIRASAVGVFQISYYGVGPTEIRIALGLYAIAAFFWGPMVVPGIGITPIDLFGCVLFPGVFLSFVLMVWREAAVLSARGE